MKTLQKNCIICNKEFIGTLQTKLCSKECKKQNTRNISKKIQRDRTLEERIKHAEKCSVWRKKVKYRNPTKYTRGIGIKYKLKVNLNSRCRAATKRQTVTPSKPVMDLLGCSIEDFMNYLENLFKEGMVWFNYGNYGWHMDHIKPCIEFDLKDPEQQEKCFHYTNIQPLWWWENLSKNDMISHLKKSTKLKDTFLKPKEIKNDEMF